MNSYICSQNYHGILLLLFTRLLEVCANLPGERSRAHRRARGADGRRARHRDLRGRHAEGLGGGHQGPARLQRRLGGRPPQAQHGPSRRPEQEYVSALVPVYTAMVVAVAVAMATESAFAQERVRLTFL